MEHDYAGALPAGAPVTTMELPIQTTVDEKWAWERAQNTTRDQPPNQYEKQPEEQNWLNEKLVFCAHCSCLLTPNYDSISIVLSTLVLLSVLFASVVFGLVTTIGYGESVKGDKISLAFASPRFRCHFTPNASFEFCNPSGTLSPDCSKPLSVSMCHPNMSSIAEVASSEGCSGDAYALARRIAHNVSDDAFLEWMDKQLGGRVAGDLMTSWLLEGDSDTECWPSQRAYAYGFKACLYVTLALVLALYLMLSLLLSNGKQHRAQLIAWWMPLGCLSLVVSVGLIVAGLKEYLTSLQYFFMLRTPYVRIHAAWRVYTIDDFNCWMLIIPVILGSHLLLVMLRPLMSYAYKVVKFWISPKESTIGHGSGGFTIYNK